MRIDTNVIVDEIIGKLMDSNISNRSAVRLSVCQLLKTLGLAKLKMTVDESTLSEINFCFYHTKALKKIMRNSRARAEEGRADNDNDDDNEDYEQEKHSKV